MCLPCATDEVPDREDRGPVPGDLANGELDMAKEAIAETLGALPDGTWFAMFFMDRSMFRFPVSELPARLSPETRAQAASLLASIRPGSASCDTPGLLAALRCAELSPITDDLVIYISDGSDEANYLETMRQKVRDANHGFATLHTISIGSIQPLNEAHLQQLAAENGGEYHNVPLR